MQKHLIVATYAGERFETVQLIETKNLYLRSSFRENENKVKKKYGSNIPHAFPKAVDRGVKKNITLGDYTSTHKNMTLGEYTSTHPFFENQEKFLRQ